MSMLKMVMTPLLLALETTTYTAAMALIPSPLALAMTISLEKRVTIPSMLELVMTSFKVEPEMTASRQVLVMM